MTDGTSATGSGETPNPAAGRETGQTGGEGQPAGKRFTDDETAALLKENMQYKARLAALESKAQKAEEERLKQQGDHLKLAEMATARAAAAERAAIRAELKAIAAREGLVDLDLVQLIDAGSVKLSESGVIEGAAEVVAAFKAAKPAFFQVGNGAANVPGTARPGTTGAGGFKSWDEYLSASEADRKAWAVKHPDAFRALAAAATSTNRR